VLTPGEKKLRAQIAANTRWAKEDREQASARQRRIMLERFENAVDPNCELLPAERSARARNAMAAHMQSLAFKSVRARRRAGDASGRESAPRASASIASMSPSRPVSHSRTGLNLRAWRSERVPGDVDERADSPHGH
jgi:hypothetical protein